MPEKIPALESVRIFLLSALFSLVAAQAAISIGVVVIGWGIVGKVVLLQFILDDIRNELLPMLLCGTVIWAAILCLLHLPGLRRLHRSPAAAAVLGAITGLPAGYVWLLCIFREFLHPAALPRDSLWIGTAAGILAGAVFAFCHAFLTTRATLRHPPSVPAAPAP